MRVVRRMKVPNVAAAASAAGKRPFIEGGFNAQMTRKEALEILGLQ